MSLFDKYANNYDEGHVKAIKLSGLSTAFLHEYKVQEVFKYLQSSNQENKELKLLNFGCGTGNSERYLRKYLPNTRIYSIDISEESVEVAKKDNQNIDNIVFSAFDGLNIPFEEKFDIIFVANIFHHIPWNQHSEVMNNLYKQLNCNGIIFLFELNPINPLTMWVAINNDYKFDKNSRLLSPFYAKKLLANSGFMGIKRKYTIFFPGFLSCLFPLEKYLKSVPIGAHYFYTAQKK
jgi:SAM-dependent methyltransferase